MEKVKVFLSDPQVLFREGIHFILSGEDDFEVIGETTSNQEAFTLIETNPPNIAVLSLKDADKASGTDITRRIKRNYPSISVILTLEKKEEEHLFAAIKSGASACITKDTDPEYLLDVIRVVAQGSYPIMEEMLLPGLATMVLAEFEDLSVVNEQLDNLLGSLTTKETQVLTTIAAGNTIEQVAEKLDITEETIRRNLRLILNKLISNEQARAVIEAAQRGMPALIAGAGKTNGKANDYVTKAEFNEFKDTLMERLKSFIGELA